MLMCHGSLSLVPGIYVVTLCNVIFEPNSSLNFQNIRAQFRRESHNDYVIAPSPVDRGGIENSNTYTFLYFFSSSSPHSHFI